MLAPQITTHVSEAAARMMTQYKNLPGTYTVYLPNTETTIETSYIGAVVSILADRIQGVENAIYPIDSMRQFYNGSEFVATGAQLDGVGEIIGLSRGNYTDAEYLTLITAQIAATYSDGSIETVLSLVQLMFQTKYIQMYENYPAEVSFAVFVLAVDPQIIPLSVELVRKSLSAGVNLGFITTPSGSNPFFFSDLNGISGSTGTTAGFGDIVNYPASPPAYSSIGGVFAKLIT